MKDFAPIALITSTPTVLVVTPELGVKSVQGADRARQGQARHAVVRLVRRRQLDPSRARAVQVAGRRQDHAHPLHRQPAGGDRPAGRPHSWLFLAGLDGDAARRAPASSWRSRVTDAKRSTIHPRPADHDRSRRAGLRIGAVVRDRRAGRHAAADHRQAAHGGQRGAASPTRCAKALQAQTVAAHRRHAARSSAATWRASSSAGLRSSTPPGSRK